jgi:flagellar biosynthesis chaperone FliJ
MTRILLLAGVFLASAAAADISIRQVILYKSGVGYFERSGQLGPGESARLDFKASDMNDVLKSLTIEDRNGGKVTGLRYDSSEPLDRKLADFPFKIGEQASLAVFVDQMKGAKVEIKYGAETVSGAIVSGRMVGADERHPEREQLVLMLDSGELRTFDLAAASAIRFADPKVQSQLRDYLAVVNQSRSQDKRSIYIDSSDAKERQIAASYMVPTPVWKSSYRLIFNDKTDPTLEGWAIIDNTTGEDWNNVVLAVVSGRPVSFISKLYEPKYVPRPTVELPEDRAATPKVYSGAMAGVGGAVNRSGIVGSVAAPAPPQLKAAESFLPRDAEQDLISSVAVDVASADLGELFEYRFGTPVTVKKDESAMLPFLQQKIGARKLLIYSENYGEHPMSAAELTNSTGKTLDGGPITVFEGASYSGEALMTTLKAADKRLISYAVDLGTRVTTAFDSSRSAVREIHVNRGMLTTRSAMEEARTYTIRNVDARPKTLIIEQTQRPEYKVLNPKPTETTTTANRFEVKLGPDSTEKFPVAEERVYDTTTAVSSLTPDVLLAYVQNKALSDAGRRQLQQIVDLKRQIAELDSQIRQAESDIKSLVDDQARIRQNIQSLNAVSGQQEQVQKYARQLADQESRLAAQRDHLSDLRKQKTSQESNLSDLIAKLEF